MEKFRSQNGRATHGMMRSTSRRAVACAACSQGITRCAIIHQHPSNPAAATSHSAKAARLSISAVVREPDAAQTVNPRTPTQIDSFLSIERPMRDWNSGMRGLFPDRTFQRTPETGVVTRLDPSPWSFRQFYLLGDLAPAQQKLERRLPPRPSASAAEPLIRESSVRR
ncbi:predicted protein [Chaetomium globosum CBS 148.51]|uniref:Uncharacterized protein n=1 Tax=Chaetomium globosum (strain ATCC 6205 / CBS 148.51 / DSM 1962 / NBRC 6347 / NRRL 1970) TaxID=306901 RepID=Q2HBX2_CHAGB|nr:uncharacterized protein CHGG_02282 [Chaetomium globosum CBS 148.51]EAQ90347.1 predicted protein [Chaetomium globosum CBS 148.51]